MTWDSHKTRSRGAMQLSIRFFSGVVYGLPGFFVPPEYTNTRCQRELYLEG